MVVKLTGIVEGHPVICERVSGDTWTCTVPATLSGTYVAEFTAIDDAGNVAYCAQYIIAIDLSALCVHIIKDDHCYELVDTDLEAEIVRDDLCVEIVQPVCMEGI